MNQHRDPEDVMERIATSLQRIAEYFKRFLNPFSLHIKFQGQEIDMPATRDVSQGPITATPVAKNTAGEVPILAANIKWSADSVGYATMVQNPDGSATFTPLEPGVVNVVVVDTANNLKSATDTLTITKLGPPPPAPNVPTEIGISWGK